MNTILHRTGRATHVDLSVAKRIYFALAALVTVAVGTLLFLDRPSTTIRFQTIADLKKQGSIKAIKGASGLSKEQEDGFAGGYIGNNFRIIPDAQSAQPEERYIPAVFAVAHDFEPSSEGDAIDFGIGGAEGNGDADFGGGDLGLPEFPKSEWKIPDRVLPDIRKPVPDKPVEIFLQGIIPPPALAQIQECCVVYSMKIEPCGSFQLAVQRETPEGQNLARGVTPALNDRLFVRPPEVKGEKVGTTITFFVAFGPNQSRQVVSSDGVIVHTSQ